MGRRLHTQEEKVGGIINENRACSTSTLASETSLMDTQLAPFPRDSTGLVS